MKQARLSPPPSSSLAVIQASCTRARTRREDVALTHGLISHLQSGQLTFTLQHCLSVVTHGYYISAKRCPLSLVQLWRGKERRLRQNAPQGRTQLIAKLFTNSVKILWIIWAYLSSVNVGACGIVLTCNFSVLPRLFFQAVLFTLIACFLCLGLFSNFMNNRLSWKHRRKRNKKKLYSVFD